MWQTVICKTFEELKDNLGDSNVRICYWGFFFVLFCFFFFISLTCNKLYTHHFHFGMKVRLGWLSRGVRFLNFHHFLIVSLIRPQCFLIFFLILVLRVEVLATPLWLSAETAKAHTYKHTTRAIVAPSHASLALIPKWPQCD